MEGGPSFAVGVAQPPSENDVQQVLIKSSTVRLKGVDFCTEKNMCEVDEQSPCDDSFVRLKIEQPSVLEEIDHHPAQVKVEACPPALTEGISNLDIDRRRGAKKVMPVVADEEAAEGPECEKLSVKRKSQKRPVSTMQTAVPMPPERDIQHLKQCSGDMLKLTHDLINGAKSGQARSVIYQPEEFSGFDNIECAPHLLDRGSFGEVRKVVDKKTKQELVLKKITKPQDFSANEITVPIQFPDVRSIAQTCGCCFDGRDLYIVMEDAGQSLRSLIHDPEFILQLQESMQQEWICQHLLSAVAALAKAGVTHRDIKPENVCYNKNTRVTKLVDFGSSKTAQDCPSFSGTTVEYADPQACQFMSLILRAPTDERKHMTIPQLGEKYDVWALLMVSMFLVIKKHPMVAIFYDKSGFYPDVDPQELAKIRYGPVAQEIAKLTDDSLWANISPMISQVSALMLTVLRAGLQVDENKRPQASVLRDFLQQALVGANVCHPKKRAKLMEVDSTEMPIEDEEMLDVDLEGKRLRLAPHAGQTHTFMQGITADMPVDQGPARVALKTPASMSHQTGKILAPGKLDRGSVNPPLQEQRMQQARRKVEPQNDYDDLVGFLLKPSGESTQPKMKNEPKPPFLPQNNRWAGAYSQVGGKARLSKVESPYSPPAVGFASPVMYQQKQHLQGLTGRQIEPDGSPVKPSGLDQEHIIHQQMCGGNIPLTVQEDWNERNELCRLKATARRRSRNSND